MSHHEPPPLLDSAAGCKECGYNGYKNMHFPSCSKDTSGIATMPRVSQVWCNDCQRMHFHDEACGPMLLPAVMSNAPRVYTMRVTQESAA